MATRDSTWTAGGVVSALHEQWAWRHLPPHLHEVVLQDVADDARLIEVAPPPLGPEVLLLEPAPTPPRFSGST
jgi:hypothetical protein